MIWDNADWAKRIYWEIVNTVFQRLEKQIEGLDVLNAEKSKNEEVLSTQTDRNRKKLRKNKLVNKRLEILETGTTNLKVHVLNTKQW